MANLHSRWAAGASSKWLTNRTGWLLRTSALKLKRLEVTPGSAELGFDAFERDGALAAFAVRDTLGGRHVQ